MRDYYQLSQSIRGNLNPDNLPFPQSFEDEISTLSYSNVLVFIRTAMKGVEPEYTNKSKEAGKRVKAHLKDQLTDVIFRYQGSVMTNTHIKGASDIDLLTISDKFYSYNITEVKNILNGSVQTNLTQRELQKLYQEQLNHPYYNSLKDLFNIRQNSEITLSSIYQICDISKPKSIKITNKSLKRDVDIVVANWYDDVKSIVNNKDNYRGIQVYNKKENRKGNPDYPFLSIERVNEKSKLTNGRLKKMIRFLKNVKYLSKIDIKLSSFDINAICYNINTQEYIQASFVELVPVLYQQFSRICTDKYYADSIASVDDREYIFRDQPEKLKQLQYLFNEVQGIFHDIRTMLVV